MIKGSSQGMPPKVNELAATYVLAALRSGKLIRNMFIPQFEDILLDISKRKYVATFSSNTSAHACLFAALGMKDIALVYQGNGFPTPAFEVERAGASLIWMDIDPWTLDPNLGQIDVITKFCNGSAIVEIMDTGGRISSNLMELRDLSKRNRFLLIEDAAHSFGSSRNGRNAGEIVDHALYSFSATKIFTSGIGGAIVSDDEETAKLTATYANQGKEELFGPTQCDWPGFSCRYSEILAAVACAAYEGLFAEIEVRREQYIAYLYELADVIHFYNYGDSNFYKLMVMPPKDRVKDFSRCGFAAFLQEKGIQLSACVYDRPSHLQKGFGGKYELTFLPGTTLFCEKHFCLPIGSHLSIADVQTVCEAVKEYFTRSK